MDLVKECMEVHEEYRKLIDEGFTSNNWYAVKEKLKFHEALDAKKDLLRTVNIQKTVLVITQNITVLKEERNLLLETFTKNLETLIV